MDTYKQDDAFILYTEGGMSLHETANVLNLHVNTLYKWANEGKWNEIIEDDTTLHITIRTALMNECEKIVQGIETQKREPTKKEAEMIKRLSTLSKRKTGLMPYGQHLDTLGKFNNYMIHTNLDFAKELIQYMRSYIQELERQQDIIKN